MAQYCSLAVLLALSACAPAHLHRRQGVPLPLHLPQAAEQCRAQPTLDWCVHAKR